MLDLRMGMKEKAKIAVLIAIGVYFVAFLGFNMETAAIDFLFFEIKMPLVFLILFSALVGAAFVLGFSTLHTYRRRREEAKGVDVKADGAKP